MLCVGGVLFLYTFLAFHAVVFSPFSCRRFSCLGSAFRFRLPIPVGLKLKLLERNPFTYAFWYRWVV